MFQFFQLWQASKPGRVRRSLARSALARGELQKSRRARQRFLRLVVEQLEARSLLATIIVTTELDIVNPDDTVTSLREAVIQANCLSDHDTITFAGKLANKPVVLSQVPPIQITITQTVTIQGLGAGQTTVDGGNASRLFDITNKSSNVTFDGLTLTGGKTTANNEDGGAIRSQSVGQLTIQNSTISGNSTEGLAAPGGGISAQGLVAVTNSAISGNSTAADEAHGGGIFGSGSVTVTNSTISGNSTAGKSSGGGGIAVGSGGFGNDADGSVTVTNSTISGNSTAGDSSGGGGIFADGSVAVTNSTISGNFITGRFIRGGGIFTNGSVTVTNSTITGNSVTDGGGGGVWSFDGPVTIRNSIVAGNNDDSGQFPDFRPAGTLIVQFSLIGDSSGTELAPGNGNLLDIDPLLGPLADNGGKTRTHRPLAGSPVIDAGNNGLAVDPVAQAALTTDQRGAPFARILDGPDGDETATVDMGAVEEFQLADLSLVVDTTIDENDGNYDLGDLSLREAIVLANFFVGADRISFAAPLFSIPRLISLELRQLEIRDNLTISGPGANRLTISGNNASRIFSVNDDVGPTQKTVRISGLTISGGNASDGGGIHNEETLTVESCAILGNSATTDGGGGISNIFGNLTIRNTTLSGNTATNSQGGGILSNNLLTVENSTLSGNRTTTTGGGIANVLGTVTVRNSTITQNQSGLRTGEETGGGIFFIFGAVTLHNTLVADNFRGTGTTTDDDISGDLIAASTNNLIGTGGTGGLTNGTKNGNQVGVADPQLGPLANNGGPTLTHALLVGSLAINTGNNAEAPPGLTTDQRGGPFARIFNSIIDVGAVESQPSFPWHNFAKPFDVGGGLNKQPDGFIVAGDALDIINYLNAFGAGPVPANAALGQPFGFLDVSGGPNGIGDNFVTAADALDVINFLNAGLGGEGEAPRGYSRFGVQGSGDGGQETEDSGMDELIALLAVDTVEQAGRRKRA